MKAKIVEDMCTYVMKSLLIDKVLVNTVTTILHTLKRKRSWLLFWVEKLTKT